MALLSLRMTKLGTKAPPSVAIVVSKKVAKTAVSRNRIRRRLYEGFAPFVPLLPKGTRYLVYPKKEVLTASFKDIRESLKQLLDESAHRL